VERVLMDEVVETDYGQFDIAWDGDIGFDGEVERYFAGQVNGLVGAAHAGGVYLHFGRRSGGSAVRIVMTETAPGDPDELWEDVVEVSIEVPAGAEVGWASWAGETGGELDGIAGGSYRLRVSARGRDVARDDEFADELLDAYLLELWPDPRRPDAILRVGSQDAEYWHREWGGRR
jgi:hypothetical protein